MVKITHPSMRKSRDPAAPIAAPKTYIVDDPTEERVDEMPMHDDLDDHLSQFEKPKSPVPQYSDNSAQFPIPEGKPVDKSRTLENLIFMGRATKEVEIMGHKFELSTMTHREHSQVVKMMYSFGDAADLFTIRILTLANALRSVDDVDINEIHIDGEFESDYHRRMSIVDNIQLAIVSKLHDEYEQLVEDSNTLLEDGDEIKKS